MPARVPFRWGPFRDECLVSYLEKREIDPQYVLGKCPGINPSEYWLPPILHNRLLPLLLPMLYRIAVRDTGGGLVKLLVRRNVLDPVRTHARERVHPAVSSP